MRLPDLVAKFTVSVIRPEMRAAAIAEDMDGQSRLFVLDLKKLVALTPADSWDAARKLYWSPAHRYLLAWCSYEGQWFISFDFVQKRFRDRRLAPRDRKGRCWLLVGKPEWRDDETVEFNIDEACDPFADASEHRDDLDDRTKGRVRMHAGSLEMTEITRPKRWLTPH